MKSTIEANTLPVTRSFEEREVVRHNWTRLGYVYWTTRDMVEYWKHPETEHVVEMATY